MTDDKCPKCGAEMISGAGNYSFYACMSYQRARGEFHETCGCLRRQLSQVAKQRDLLAEAVKRLVWAAENCIGAHGIESGGIVDASEYGRAALALVPKETDNG